MYLKRTTGRIKKQQEQDELKGVQEIWMSQADQTAAGASQAHFSLM